MNSKHGLTTLTRIGNRSAEGRAWLSSVLRRRNSSPELVAAAIETAAETGPSAATALEESLDHLTSEEVAARLYRDLPKYSANLRSYSLRLTEKLIGMLRERPDARRSNNWARLHTDLATRLSASGRQSEALRAAEVAASHFRASDQATGEEKVASMLSLSGAYANNGRFAEALEQAGQALELAGTTEFAADADREEALASSSFMCASRHMEAGQLEPAINYARAAVDHYQLLTRSHSVKHRMFLAKSLVLLGSILHRNGDVGRAKEAVTEARDSLSKLTDERRDVYSSELWLALNQLGELQSLTGDPRAGMTSSAQALEIITPLFAAQPDSYRADYVACLNNHAARLRETGDYQGACDEFKQAAEAMEPLASNPVYRGQLAITLTNLTGLLGELGRAKEAIRFSEQAVAHFEELSQLAPAYYEPQLAATLLNQALVRYLSGDQENSVADGEAAVTVYRRLSTANAAGYRPELANALSNLSSLHSDPKKSLAASAEAVRLLRDCVTQDALAYRGKLALALNNHGLHLQASGRLADAERAAEESSRIYETLVSEGAGNETQHLAMALANLANARSKLSDLSGAMEVGERAARLYEDENQRHPEAFAERAAQTRHNLLAIAVESGDVAEAVRNGLRSLDLLRPLTQKDVQHARLQARRAEEFAKWAAAQDEHQAAAAGYQEAIDQNRMLTSVPDARAKLVLLLNNLSNQLSRLDRTDEALSAAREALAIVEDLSSDDPVAFATAHAVILNTLSRRVECDEERNELARQSAETMAPDFLRKPDALRGEMQSIFDDYLAAMQRDHDLKPIVDHSQVERMLEAEKTN